MVRRFKPSRSSKLRLRVKVVSTNKLKTIKLKEVKSMEITSSTSNRVFMIKPDKLEEFFNRAKGTGWSKKDRDDAKARLDKILNRKG